MIRQVREDDPVPAEVLRVEAIELRAMRPGSKRDSTHEPSRGVGRKGARRQCHARLSRRRKREAMTWALDGVR